MITGYIRNQTLEIKQNRIVADSIDYLTARFFFQTSDWRGFDIWAHFEQGKNNYLIRLTDGKITSDKHLNLSSGEWLVYLHGTSAEGVRITTNTRRIIVEKTGVVDGEPLPEIPLSVAEQISEMAQSALDIAESVRADADEGKFQGTPGAPGKDGYTPEKGVDYYTEAEKEEFVQAVIEALPNGDEVSY